jgi:hypothetical protein
MATDSAITLIDAEIAKLKQVRSLLAHTGKVAAKIVAIKSKIKERKTRLAATKKAAKATAKPAAKAVAKKAAKALAKKAVKAAAKAPAKARKPRVLSPEARQRIADAQRKRWAATKATA